MEGEGERQLRASTFSKNALGCFFASHLKPGRMFSGDTINSGLSGRRITNMGSGPPGVMYLLNR